MRFRLLPGEAPPSKEPSSSFLEKRRIAARSLSESANLVTKGAGGIAAAIAKKVDSGFDKTISAKIVSTVGASIRNNMVPAGSPACLETQLGHMHDHIWSTAGPNLRDEITNAIGISTIGDRLYKLHGWPDEYPPFWRGPYTWFRAMYMYSNVPADCSFVMKYCGYTFYPIIFAFKLIDETSVLTWVIHFLLMDRTDEFQVCIFILKFKMLQFISPGLTTAATLGMKFLLCIEDDHACESLAPGRMAHADYLLAMEVVRLLIIYYCGYLLKFEHTYGGKEEIAALEMVRASAAAPPLPLPPDAAPPPGAPHSSIAMLCCARCASPRRATWKGGCSRAPR